MTTPPQMPTPDTPQVLLEHHLKALRLCLLFSSDDRASVALALALARIQ